MAGEHTWNCMIMKSPVTTQKSEVSGDMSRVSIELLEHSDTLTNCHLNVTRSTEDKYG